MPWAAHPNQGSPAGASKARRPMANPMRLTPGYQSHPRHRTESEDDPGMQRAGSAGEAPPNMGPAEGAQGNSTGGRGSRAERAAQRRQGTAPRGARRCRGGQGRKRQRTQSPSAHTQKLCNLTPAARGLCSPGARRGEGASRGAQLSQYPPWGGAQGARPSSATPKLFFFF